MSEVGIDSLVSGEGFEEVNLGWAYGSLEWFLTHGGNDNLLMERWKFDPFEQKWEKRGDHQIEGARVTLTEDRIVLGYHDSGSSGMGLARIVPVGDVWLNSTDPGSITIAWKDKDGGKKYARRLTRLK